MRKKIKYNREIIFLFCVMLSSFVFSQRPLIGFFYGSSMGYNAIYSSPADHHGLLDVNFNSEESFVNSIVMLNDGDLSNNIEAFNGAHVGIMVNFSIVKGIAIQPEIEYQQLDFNHILYQNGSSVIFNEFALSGLENDNQYKIASYFWKVNYINFPFLIKLYPTKNLFFQLGFKFGFLVKAEETRSVSSFNIQNDQYTSHELLLNDRVVYEFFDSKSGMDNHGFDKTEWPFNWNGAILGGIGYEAKTFYCSLRYSLGLLPFFKELNDKDDDFFDIYNTEIDDAVYDNFEVLSPVINNNFKLQTIHLTIGMHLSN